MTTLAFYLWHQQTRGIRTKLPRATESNTQIHPFEASDMPSSTSNTLPNVSVSVESHKSPLPQVSVWGRYSLVHVTHELSDSGIGFHHHNLHPIRRKVGPG